LLLFNEKAVSQATEIFENLRSALSDAKEMKGKKSFRGIL